jgi:prepilin-type N-terminal cleavage/methylation domain-containing protein
MVRVSPKLNSQSGVSLVELLVVIVIIAVVASLAIFSRGGANETFKRQNGSRMLKAAFERARFDSVKRRADGSTARPFAYVQVDTNGFTLRTFSEPTGGGTPVARDEPTLFGNGVVAAHQGGGTPPVTISFNFRGATLGGSPEFYVCEVSCASPTNSNSDLVIVTATGTVNLLPGAAPTPSFTNTTLVGTTAATDSINFDVVIPTPTP